VTATVTGPNEGPGQSDWARAGNGCTTGVSFAAMDLRRPRRPLRRARTPIDRGAQLSSVGAFVGGRSTSQGGSARGYKKPWGASVLPSSRAPPERAEGGDFTVRLRSRGWPCSARDRGGRRQDFHVMFGADVIRQALRPGDRRRPDDHRRAPVVPAPASACSTNSRTPSRSAHGAPSGAFATFHRLPRQKRS